MSAASRAHMQPEDGGRRVLLFIDRREPGAPAAVARFAGLAWPPGTTAEVVDLSTDGETARWYGITTGPAVAVVCDGMLLAIEHGCSDEACTRVRELASRRDPRAFSGLLLTPTR